MSGTGSTPFAVPRLRLRVEESVLPRGTGDAAFARASRADAGEAPHVVLLSGGDHACASRSIAALSPAILLETKGRRIRLHTARGISEGEGDPFSVLEELLAAARETPDPAGIPAAAGYVAYEAGRLIERLPGEVADRLGLPDLFFVFPTRVRVHDRRSGSQHEYALAWSDDVGELPPLSVSATPTGAPAAGGPVGENHAAAHAGFTVKEYMDAVRRVRQYILDGDVYQVNLSQRFRFPLPVSAFDLWLQVFTANPAPFYAWVEAGSHQVLSASMERFALVDGDRIETRPIKGTRPRGRDANEDRQFEEDLLRSGKDDAELSMIVDLERNDIGKVCRTGSVRVVSHKHIERYANVLHLVSVVEGRLRPGTGLAEIFRALFPGGSVTGCPKIRAMEIIDELEPETRHVYTGAIGYVATGGGMDFNIAIRSAVVMDGVCHLSVGGGIVHDSDPRGEYLETLHKGRSFFDLAEVRPDSDERS